MKPYLATIILLLHIALTSGFRTSNRLFTTTSTSRFSGRRYEDIQNQNPTAEEAFKPISRLPIVYYTTTYRDLSLPSYISHIRLSMNAHASTSLLARRRKIADFDDATTSTTTTSITATTSSHEEEKGAVVLDPELMYALESMEVETEEPSNAKSSNTSRGSRSRSPKRSSSSSKRTSITSTSTRSRGDASDGSSSDYWEEQERKLTGSSTRSSTTATATTSTAATTADDDDDVDEYIDGDQFDDEKEEESDSSDSDSELLGNVNYSRSSNIDSSTSTSSSGASPGRERRRQRTRIFDDVDTTSSNAILYNKEEEDEEDADADAVPQSKLPIVAVIGRPNTGKSTIVNRICDAYNAGSIVDDTPGVTRDRSYRPAVWNGYNFQVVDTGGILFDDKPEDVFANKITEQAMIAIDESVACIFVCDGITGVTNQDRDVAEWLRRRKSNIPIYLAVNKCESEVKGLAQALDFSELGLGNPIPVSGIHGMGIGDILDQITEKHMKKIVNVLQENVTNVAFIGRPNVGKSSLFNKLYGKNRTIVSDIAGTTRDPIDEIVIRGGDKYRIIDTAGIRRKAKVDFGTEFFMINRAFKAIRRADVCVLLLDATEGVLVQDRELADRIVDEGRACVIALNKWDVVPSKDEKTYIGCIDNIHASLNHLKWADVVLVSAKTGQRIDKVLVAAKKAVVQYRRWVPTKTLTEIVNDALNFHSPARVGGKSGRIHYVVQSSTAPPTFVLFCNDPKLFGDSYRQYLDRKIRESLGFEGTPIRIILRQKTLRKVNMGKDENGDLKRKFVR